MTQTDFLTILNDAIGVDLTMDSELGDAGWDSLAHAALLADLDARLEGKLATLPGVVNATSARAMWDVLVDSGLGVP